MIQYILKYLPDLGLLVSSGDIAVVKDGVVAETYDISFKLFIDNHMLKTLTIY